VVRWPLDVEGAPKLVDLVFFVGSLLACLDGGGDQDVRHSVFCRNAEIDGGRILDVRLFLERLQVKRFGSLTLTEDD